MSNSSPDVKMLRYEHGQLAYYMEQRQTLEKNITDALHWLAKGLETQGWNHIRPVESLVDTVIDEFHLMMVGGTLVAFSIAEPWFMDCQVLEEEFVAPVGLAPAMPSTVVKALEACARATGCKMLSLGTRANPHHKAMARFFTDAGCRLATIGLVKEITNG